MMNETVSIAKALSDRGRLWVWMFLVPGELCVCQIVEALGLAPSTVSRHLSILQQAGFLLSRKDRRWVYYSLAGHGLYDRPHTRGAREMHSHGHCLERPCRRRPRVRGGPCGPQQPLPDILLQHICLALHYRAAAALRRRRRGSAGRDSGYRARASSSIWEYLSLREWRRGSR